VAGGVRVAELVASLSYAADLGLGQPMQHCMRQTVIASRLGTLAGASADQREATYHLGLLLSTFCHADAAEQAAWFGDDIAFKRDGVAVYDMNTAQTIAFLMRRAASHGSARSRARRVVTFPVAGMRQVLAFTATHSMLGAEFVSGLGLGDVTVTAVAQGYEQWDGRGQPKHLRGEEICLPARLVQVASAGEVYARTRGVEAARHVVRRNAGRQFDPAIAELFCEHVYTLLDGLDDAATWDAILAAEPNLGVSRVEGADLDRVLETIADLVDMKSPWLTGHSRGVADLVADAGRLAGADTLALRRAGLLHDLGRLGVSNTIWDKPGLLTDAEWERVRLYPYWTDRMLHRITDLGSPRQIAARHHERLDGSGYPSGLRADSLTMADRLLAAADVYHAMTEPRSHRPALDPAAAADQVSAEVAAGRLDADAVSAVLSAAGHRSSVRPDRPDGLTVREVEVLGLLARGHTTRQIARTLAVTPKTAANHVEHIYTKIRVSSRAAATLYATRHGLVGTYIRRI
jgi:HD-GYP domain-containing protein (c-di-GMP phosphodiesterase class II)